MYVRVVKMKCKKGAEAEYRRIGREILVAIAMPERAGALEARLDETGYDRAAIDEAPSMKLFVSPVAGRDCSARRGDLSA